MSRIVQIFETEDEVATCAVARQLANAIHGPAFIGLKGDLGAGKTAFARGFIRSLPGIDPGEDVPSPTFTLVQMYEGTGAPLWHFDLYRIETSAELRELGWEDAVDEGICLVEWPEKAGAALPADRLEVEIIMGQAHNARRITIAAFGAAISQFEGGLGGK